MPCDHKILVYRTYIIKFCDNTSEETICNGIIVTFMIPEYKKYRANRHACVWDSWTIYASTRIPQLLHVSIIILQQYNLTFDDVMFFFIILKKEAFMP